MRTNIVIDDDLIREAMTVSGAGTKRAVVQLALERLVQTYRQRELLHLKGLGWEGDIDEDDRHRSW